MYISKREVVEYEGLSVVIRHVLEVVRTITSVDTIFISYMNDRSFWVIDALDNSGTAPVKDLELPLEQSY
ncbi:hypothetical protein [Alkalicoccus urumqiensis]|uniref:hypothetical protein n=1 Tax=Alkalicoccus urumqiensis TaxID=1548213 RepID=UPI001159A5D0|nr:hypothetical protein [Alkalicoccus urumqiensis]